MLKNTNSNDRYDKHLMNLFEDELLSYLFSVKIQANQNQKVSASLKFRRDRNSNGISIRIL